MKVVSSNTSFCSSSFSSFSSALSISSSRARLAYPSSKRKARIMSSSFFWFSSSSSSQISILVSLFHLFLLLVLYFTSLSNIHITPVEAGIDGFWKWYQGQFHDTIIHVKPGQSAEFEHVLIDANHLLHKAARRATDLDDCLHRLRIEIRRSLKSCTPLKTCVIAFDGSAPIAKLKHQQERRAGENRINRYENISPLLLSPGTDFMKVVAEDIEKLAKEIVNSNHQSHPKWDFLKLNRSKGKSTNSDKTVARFKRKDRGDVATTTRAATAAPTTAVSKGVQSDQQQVDQYYSDLKIYISTTDSPGEGEVKIIDWINTYNHNSKDRIAVIGADADLLIQGLALPGLPNFHIYMPQEKRTALLVSLHLLILKLEALFPGQSHNIRNDMVLLLILNGNDYLPKIRGLNFKRTFRTYTLLRKEYSKLTEEGIKQHTIKNVIGAKKRCQQDTNTEKKNQTKSSNESVFRIDTTNIEEIEREKEGETLVREEEQSDGTDHGKLTHDGWSKPSTFAISKLPPAQSKLSTGEGQFLIDPIHRTFNWNFFLAFLTKLKSIISVPEYLTSLSQAPTPASILFETTQQKKFGPNTEMTIDYFQGEEYLQIPTKTQSPHTSTTTKTATVTATTSSNSNPKKERKGAAAATASQNSNLNLSLPPSKWFCTLHVGGKYFELDGPVQSKKVAKQKICRQALLSLAPDVYNYYFVLSKQSTKDSTTGEIIEEEYDLLKEEHQVRHMMKQEEEIKSHLNARKEEYIEMYLKGLLWTIQMYIDGHCGDYTYLYRNTFAPTVATITDWLTKKYEDEGEKANFELNPPISTIQPFPAEVSCIAMFPEGKMKELIPNQLKSTVASHPSMKKLKEEGKLNSIDHLLGLYESVGPEALGWNKRPTQWTVIQQQPTDIVKKQKKTSNTNILKTSTNTTISSGVLSESKSKLKSESESETESKEPPNPIIQEKKDQQKTNNKLKKQCPPKETFPIAEKKKLSLKRKKIKARIISPNRSWQKPLLAPFYSKGAKIGTTPISFRFQKRRRITTTANSNSSDGNSDIQERSSMNSNKVEKMKSRANKKTVRPKQPYKEKSQNTRTGQNGRGFFRKEKERGKERGEENRTENLNREKEKEASNFNSKRRTKKKNNKSLGGAGATFTPNSSSEEVSVLLVSPSPSSSSSPSPSSSTSPSTSSSPKPTSIPDNTSNHMTSTSPANFLTIAPSSSTAFDSQAHGSIGSNYPFGSSGHSTINLMTFTGEGEGQNIIGGGWRSTETKKFSDSRMSRLKMLSFSHGFKVTVHVASKIVTKF